MIKKNIAQSLLKTTNDKKIKTSARKLRVPGNAIFVRINIKKNRLSVGTK